MTEQSASVGGVTVGRPVSRDNEPWMIGEVALVYLVRKSPGAKKMLADLLCRSEGAIDFAWRWCDGANFPKEAENRIEECLKWVRHVLGTGGRSKLEL